YPVEDQVVSIWAGTNGKLDDVAVEDVLRFERELLDHLARHTSILTTLRETNVLDDETVAELETAVDEFKRTAWLQGPSASGVGSEEFKELADADISQEQIVKQKKH